MISKNILRCILADEFNIDQIEPEIKIFVEQTKGHWSLFDPGDEVELEKAEVFFLKDWLEKEDRASNAASSRLSTAVDGLVQT
jgi:hypothetical protein